MVYENFFSLSRRPSHQHLSLDHLFDDSLLDQTITLEIEQEQLDDRNRTIPSPTAHENIPNERLLPT